MGHKHLRIRMNAKKYINFQAWIVLIYQRIAIILQATSKNYSKVRY